MATVIRPSVVALAAGATNANVLAGNRFEFVPRLSHVAIYAIQHLTATMGNIAGLVGVTNLVTMTVSFGNVILLDAGLIPGWAEGIVKDSHQIVAGVADGGDRLIISVTNGSAIIVDIPIMVEITDL